MVSHEACVGGLCATCCTDKATLCNGEDVEMLGGRLARKAWGYHATTQATVVFLAPHASEAYLAILVWALPTCGKYKVEDCRAARQHMATLCSMATFRDRHGIRVLVDMGVDSRCSCELQAALYANGTLTHP